MLVLGLDIGTTGTKAVAYDEGGTALASAYEGYPLIAPHPGWVELDSAVMVRAIEGVIVQVTEQVGQGRIAALAASVLGEAVVPVDGRGRFLHHTIPAVDGRATAQATWLAERLGSERFFEITGQPLHPITTVTKILWLKEHKPEIFAATDKFLCWNDALALVLGLEPAIAPSLAARTGLYDLRKGAWCEEILELAGLTPERLARIVPAGEMVGEIPAEIGRRLGLAERCVLVSGGWDQACAALGSGAIDAGVVVNGIGSTDSLNASFSEINTSAAMRESNLSCTPHALRGLYLTVAYSLTGGNLLQWWRERFGQEEEAEAARMGENFYDVLVRRALESRHPALVLAHFAGTGTPHMDARSMGAMLGLTLSTERADIARGLIEGIAFEMALNLKCLERAGLKVEKLLAGGGGAKNPALLQLRANIFGRPLTRLENPEPGCTACAMLALCALKPTIDPRALSQDWARLGGSVDPRPAEAVKQEQRRAIYEELYPALAGIHHQLADLTA